MDTVLGVQFKGGVVIAADQSNARSILIYQSNLDKIKKLTSHSAMGVSGPNCDLVTFTEFVSKNLQLYEMRHEGMQLSTKAQANFCRNELAVALRKGPFQVSALLGGYDVTTDTASLYYLDYMGTLQQIPFGAQGYAQYFTLSTMDREYRQGLNEAAAIDIITKSIHELKSRFMIKQDNYIIKVIDKDGVRVHSQGADPADT